MALGHIVQQKTGRKMRRMRRQHKRAHRGGKHDHGGFSPQQHRQMRRYLKGRKQRKRAAFQEFRKSNPGGNRKAFRQWYESKPQRRARAYANYAKTDPTATREEFKTWRKQRQPKMQKTWQARRKFEATHRRKGNLGNRIRRQVHQGMR